MLHRKETAIMTAPVNKNATKEARSLLQYLYETAGNKIITGQHTQTVPMEEISHIRKITGKEPKLRGFELLSYSPNINFQDASKACLTEIYENQNTMDTAIDWAKNNDGIVTLTFHWFSPLGGRDKSFFSEFTDFDAEKILQPDTPERAAFYKDMDKIAEQLQRFQSEKIPVLWRPFHESEGTWFWWGAKGPETAAKLYKLMYNYYTSIHHLDNLLWVWNCPEKEGYPGDDYVDIISADIYLENREKTDYKKEYQKLINAPSKNKVAALAEIGYLPDIQMLEQSRIPWAYFMVWSKEFCISERYNKTEDLKAAYHSKYAVTLQHRH